jgi:hypothetical protein
MSEKAKRPVWPWIVVLLITVPIVYGFSFGPACWLSLRSGSAGDSWARLTIQCSGLLLSEMWRVVPSSRTSLPALPVMRDLSLKAPTEDSL